MAGGITCFVYNQLLLRFIAGNGEKRKKLLIATREYVHSPICIILIILELQLHSHFSVSFSNRNAALQRGVLFEEYGDVWRKRPPLLPSSPPSRFCIVIQKSNVFPLGGGGGAGGGVL